MWFLQKWHSTEPQTAAAARGPDRPTPAGQAANEKEAYLFCVKGMRGRFGAVVVGSAKRQPFGVGGTKPPGCLFVPSGFREGDRARAAVPDRRPGSVGALTYLVRTSSGSQDRR